MPPPLNFEEDVDRLAELWPRGTPPRLFSVDPVKYRKLFGASPSKDEYTGLIMVKRRLPPNTFSSVQRSFRFLLRCSDKLFPGFRHVWGEFLNEEWLGLVDYHKAFHRDHVVHQAQEGLVVKRLLEEVTFSSGHALADDCRKAEWTDATVDSGPVTLQQLAAYVLSLREHPTDYLYEYALQIGIPATWLIRHTRTCYRFWKTMVYNSAVTAALYHDIGYPVQFLHLVARKIDDSRFSAVIRGGDAEQAYSLFDDPLCLMPFRGYRSCRRIGLSHAMGQESNEAIANALCYSHGLPGALTFLYLNHQVMDTRPGYSTAVGRLIMEMAALAVVMHDMQGIYLGVPSGRKHRGGESRWRRSPLTPARPWMRVSFWADPVSFIVALADQIQNYGRFSAHFEAMNARREGENEPTDVFPAVAGLISRGSEIGIMSTGGRFSNMGTARHGTRDSDERVWLACEDRIAGCRLDWDGLGREFRILFRYDQKQSADYVQQRERFNPEVQADYFDPRLGYLDYGGLFERICVGVGPTDDNARTSA